MNKLSKIKYTLSILLIFFSLKSIAQDPLTKQIKKQSKVAQSNDNSNKSDTKYDKNKTSEKRTKYLKESSQVGKVKYDSEAKTQNPTQFNVSSSAPPARNPAAVRAENEKKNKTVGAVKYDSEAKTQNPTQFNVSSSAPPARNPAAVRAENEKKNKTVGKVKYDSEAKTQNPTQFNASSSAPPARNPVEVRAENEKKNKTVGAVKYDSEAKTQNPTQFNVSSSAPPARNPAEVRAENEKKNNTIGYVKDKPSTQRTDAQNLQNVGQVRYASESEYKNPTVFSNSSSSSINAPSPRARKEVLEKNMAKSANGDITAKTREDQYAIRKKKDGEISDAGMVRYPADKYYSNPTVFTPTPSGPATPHPSLVKQQNFKEMRKNADGDINENTREDQYQVRKDKSAQMATSGNVRVSFVEQRANEKEKLRESMEKNADGDINEHVREDQYQIRKDKSAQSANYSGSISMNMVENRANSKENLRKSMEENADGDIKAQTREDQYQIRKDKSEESANYTGSIKMSVVEARNQKREALKSDMEKYATGDIKASTRDAQYQIRKDKSEETANYTGSIKMTVVEARNQKREELRKDMTKYATGDIKISDLDKRAKDRRAKSAEMASYSGSFKISDLQKHQKKVRQNASDIANYQGTIKIERRVRGVHPSVMYRQGWNNDRVKRDKLRRKMLKKSRRKGDLEKPAYMDHKLPKPGYDPREAEIWYK